LIASSLASTWTIEEEGFEDAGTPGANGSVLVRWAIGIREEPKQDQI
jgi:hypothetical protein